MKTIKEKYFCAWSLCQRRIFVVNQRAKRQYCGDQCRQRDEEERLIKKQNKVCR